MEDHQKATFYSSAHCSGVLKLSINGCYGDTIWHYGAAPY